VNRVHKANLLVSAKLSKLLALGLWDRLGAFLETRPASPFCFHYGRRRFRRGICPSQTRLCALRENIHASALLCEEPLRPLRLNFKSHKVQETFTAEDAEDFAEGAEEHYGRKEFHHGICPSQTCWDAFARNRLPLLVFIQNRIISSAV